MTDSRDRDYNQEHQYRRDHHFRSEDLAACASANACYYYQMSLWWWNNYTYNLHARSPSSVSHFADQNCECVERSMIVEGDCECCQNDSEFDTERGQMNRCRDCPESPYFYDASWRRLQGEYSESGGNHPDFIVREDAVPGNNDNEDNCSCGDEDYVELNDNNNRNDEDYDNDDDDGDSDENSDVSMEVDDNFIKFLEQSERHRQEREQRKQEQLKEKDDYIEVGSIHLNTTTSAPAEQPGAKRKEEMKTLYGKHASVIMALEASLQLNYDKQCDARQPVFWPSIPLKF